MHEQAAASDETLPIIDMAPLFRAEEMAAQRQVAQAIRAACRRHGFFFLSAPG